MGVKVDLFVRPLRRVPLGWQLGRFDDVWEGVPPFWDLEIRWLSEGRSFRTRIRGERSWTPIEVLRGGGRLFGNHTGYRDVDVSPTVLLTFEATVSLEVRPTHRHTGTGPRLFCRDTPWWPSERWSDRLVGVHTQGPVLLSRYSDWTELNRFSGARTYVGCRLFVGPFGWGSFRNGVGIGWERRIRWFCDRVQWSDPISTSLMCLSYDDTGGSWFRTVWGILTAVFWVSMFIRKGIL